MSWGSTFIYIDLYGGESALGLQAIESQLSNRGYILVHVLSLVCGSLPFLNPLFVITQTVIQSCKYSPFLRPSLSVSLRCFSYTGTLLDVFHLLNPFLIIMILHLFRLTGYPDLTCAQWMAPLDYLYALTTVLRAFLSQVKPFEKKSKSP